MDVIGYILSESKTIILKVIYIKINSDEKSGNEIQDMAKTDSEIKEAMDVLYNISSDEELRRLIDLRELSIMDEQNRLNGAKKEGKADLLIKLLIRKFKILPIEYRKKLEYMSEEAIESIGVEIFDM